MYRPASLMRLLLPELTPETFALEAAASILNDPAEVGAFVLRERDAIRDQGLTGLGAAARYSDVVDAALRRILALARAKVGASAMDEAASGVAIVATGGYGRRELAPFSDIDVTFIPQREDDPVVDALVRSLFQMMMDALTRTAALKVGYAYRVADDCGSLKLQTQTSLVDSRFVAGDYELYADFRQTLRRQINPAHFVLNKEWERRVARESAGGTIYGVEPDLKSGPGGLREIHTATWMAQVRFGIWSPAVWEELIDRDVVTFRQVERMYEAIEFLHTLRNALHWRAGKQDDLLLMAQQSDIAEGLGFGATEVLTPSQNLMAVYFRHAEHINRISQRVVHWVLDSRLDLGSGLSCVRRRVECTSPELFLSQPSNLIRAFFLAQSLGIGFSPDLETLISGAIEGPGALKPDGECGPLLLRILEAPERVAVSLTIMAQMGVLGWILPEFAPLMTLAPRNSAHEYTVGYHSLEVVRRLEGMREESS
ncbi:MAG TPA: hypothetical protein VFJ58_12605, partial [Armatimonadota bacterium]|nr:hypothetical protein [Armatimonadota bacterium]